MTLTLAAAMSSSTSVLSYSLYTHTAASTSSSPLCTPVRKAVLRAPRAALRRAIAHGYSWTSIPEFDAVCTPRDAVPNPLLRPPIVLLLLGYGGHVELLEDVLRLHRHAHEHQWHTVAWAGGRSHEVEVFDLGRVCPPRRVRQP